MPDCFLYPRVSSDRQEKEGHSIPYQIRVMSEYAERENLNIVQIFTEVETAAKPGRSQFNAMVAALRRSGAPKIVLVDTTDRLTRNDIDKTTVQDLIHKHGVEFRFMRSGAIWDKNASPDDEFMQDLEVAMAKRYIRHLRRETLKGITQKIRSGGWCGLAPYGYQNNKQAKTIEIDPGEAPFVQHAFELFAKGGESIRSLRERLYQEGYFFKGGKISKSQLHYLLSSRAYQGDIEYEGQVYQGTHTPIISRETFAKVQKRLKSRSHKTNTRAFQYTGALFCGACGTSMMGELKKGGKYTYYRCWKSSNGECSQKYTNEKVIDSAMNAMIASMKLPEGYREKMLAVAQRFAKTRRILANDERNRIANEQTRLDTMLDSAYEDMLSGKISETQFERLRRKHEEKSGILTSAQSVIPEANYDSYELIKIYLELPELVDTAWFSAPNEEKGKFVRLLTSKIVIRDKEPVIVLNPVFDRLFMKIETKEKLPSLDTLRTFTALHSETIKRIHQVLTSAA